MRFDPVGGERVKAVGDGARASGEQLGQTRIIGAEDQHAARLLSERLKFTANGFQVAWMESG